MTFRNKLFLGFLSVILLVSIPLLSFMGWTIYESKKLEIFDYQNRVLSLYRSLNQYESAGPGNIVEILQIGASGEIEKPTELKGQKITDVFSAASIEMIKSSRQGIQGRVLTGRKGESWLSTFEMRDSGLVMARTESSVIWRFWLYLTFPILLLTALLISMGYFVSRAWTRVLTKDTDQLVNVLAQLNPNQEFNLSPSLFSTEFQPILFKMQEMVLRIRGFIENQKRSLKLENEVELAQKLQSSLFPELLKENDWLKIEAMINPADRCSGDWFYYDLSPQRCVIVLGDVTGHGVSSAILASVCRGLWSTLKDQGPQKILKGFDETILSLSQSTYMMTMIVVEIDRESQRLRFASAAHESPVICRKDGETYFLNSDISKRLGDQSSIDFHEYIEYSESFQQGDQIVLFTDGLYDIKVKGRSLSDVRLLKMIKNSRSKFLQQIKEISQGHKMPDDVSLIAVTSIQ